MSCIGNPSVEFRTISVVSTSGEIDTTLVKGFTKPARCILTARGLQRCPCCHSFRDRQLFILVYMGQLGPKSYKCFIQLLMYGPNGIFLIEYQWHWLLGQCKCLTLPIPETILETACVLMASQLPFSSCLNNFSFVWFYWSDLPHSSDLPQAPSHPEARPSALIPLQAHQPPFISPP